MGLDGLVWKVYSISESITKVMYINILWIGFSLVGLVLLGIFPATAAMFSVTRKWMLGDKNVPVFKTFWENYKTDFLQSNLLGFSLVLIGLILYVDLRFFQTSNQFFFQAISFLFIAFLCVYFVLLLYIFPVFVHYKYKTLEYIKYSLILAIGRPVQSVMMVIGSLVVLFILKTVPALLLFVGGGLMCVVLMWIAIKSFARENL